MPVISFKFSSEELTPEQQEGAQFDPAAVGSLLFQTREGTRFDYVTNARQHGIRWYPDLQYSVINAFADTWACICCRCPRFGCSRGVNYCGCNLYRVSFTRAQWLWAFNLICLLAHGTMAYLMLTACNGTRFGTVVNPNCTAANMEVAIYRMSSNWTDASADGFVMQLKDNGLPVRFDLLAAWFHLLSAIFHSFPVIIGPFDRFAFLYWKQIDNAWCWWRWVEYSASAPLMFFCLQLIIGLREQNTLALSWMLMFTTMVCGLATETWSRPAERDGDGYRGWVGDPKRTDEMMMVERKKRAFRNRNYLKRPERPTVYPYDQAIQQLSAQERYDYENQAVAPMPNPLTYAERKELRDYATAYTRSFVYRMIPHTFGWFPYVACWVVYFSHFLGQLNDLRQENEALFERVPDFVPYAVGGTALWFTSFTFVQWRYQYISPDHYWKTEFIYCFLSLGSKLFLGLLLYINVLMFSSFDEALNDTPRQRAIRESLMAVSPPPPVGRL